MIKTLNFLAFPGKIYIIFVEAMLEFAEKKFVCRFETELRLKLCMLLLLAFSFYVILILLFATVTHIVSQLKALTSMKKNRITCRDQK